MKRIGHLGGAIAISMALAAPANAQSDELPTLAYDMLAEVTFATTADAQCDGIKMRPAKLQNYIVGMYRELAKTGVSATDAAKHFETPIASQKIAERDAALRAKHGVAPEGTDGFCAAVRAEAKANRNFAKLMQIR